MPAEHIEKEPLASSHDLEATCHSLTKQPPGGNSPQPRAMPRVMVVNSLTTAKSMQEPPAPAKCSSPRIQSHPAKFGSRAALSVQANKSTWARSLAKSSASQAAVRRSADAVLVSAPSTASSNPKATAFRQARQRNRMQANAANSHDDDVAASVRRSRVQSATGLFLLTADRLWAAHGP